MGRAYKMKGQKRKNKTEKYDREQSVDLAGPSKKVKTDGSNSEKEENLEITAGDIPGIPIAPLDTGNNKQRVIFVLENASLEVGKVGKTHQLLSSDEHATFLAKNKRNPAADYRPDIAFQAIQTILDSRVNKSGRLKALYVKTQQGQLLEIKPHTRLPRTYKRFSGLMVQLLQDLRITATGNGEKLLRLIQNPVTQYLPTNSRKIGFSHSSEKLIDMHNYVGKINEDLDLVFVLGAMSHGKIDVDYVEDYISISEYPLSAAYAISMITNAVERKFKIV
ncbi:ribosomal RNA small subunit methyltransferase NEP1-like [Salvia splendens]|uniref:ribosomal RNA small subunit methyltransferase NEP1-like n=1 Tax=Salvia splendens TaxID=180675 RepID=UPI001C26FA11|nr:ribosomal RNA small subunit methyltransferase NEP1-like [Salvia splendens]